MKKKAKKPKTRHAAPLIRVTPPPPKPWELNAQEVELVKQHICPGASDLELQFNLTVARRFKLDPFRQQIWFVPRKDGDTKKWIPIVGINGLLHIAARDHSDFGSYSEVEYGPTIEVEWRTWGKINGRWSVTQKHQLKVPEWARAKAFKKGLLEPSVATVWWEEIYPNVDFSPVVREKPRHMLGKCSKAHVTRLAYPSTDGLYISEEFQRRDYTRDGREIEYPEANTYDSVQKEAIEVLKSKGNWCEEHNCSRSMKHLREYHFDEIGTKPEEFAASSTASSGPQSVPTGDQTSPRAQSPVQHASGPEGGAPPKEITPNAPPSAPKASPKPSKPMVAANSKPVGKRSTPEDKSTHNGGTNAPTAPQDSGLRPPQARIPVKVKLAKWSKSGKYPNLELETGKWLVCFRNHKMGDEYLFDLLITSAGKTCIFLTEETKGSDGKPYTQIARLLQMGDMEWEEDGTPVLRCEPATKPPNLSPMREPGDDSEEQWLK